MQREFVKVVKKIKHPRLSNMQGRTVGQMIWERHQHSRQLSNVTFEKHG